MIIENIENEKISWNKKFNRKKERIIFSLIFSKDFFCLLFIFSVMESEYRENSNEVSLSSDG